MSAKVVWTGEVNGLRAHVWSDGHTDYVDHNGLSRRADDASEIIATCMAQLLERLAVCEGTLQKRRIERRLQ